MKKLFKACLAVAMAASLVACGEKAAPIAKAGLGVVSTWSNGQVNSTIVALGLDKDGKIAYIDLDVAQSTPDDAAKAKTETKEELKEKYNMKGASPIGKEWFEQAEAFENWAKGKTPAEVAAVKLSEVNGHQVAKDEADLYAGCTMDVSAFIKAVEKAAANAVEVNAETVKLGRTMSNGTGQVNTDLVMVALDKDGKVIKAKWDVAQISETVTDTKSERKEGYNMKGVSPIGKEWYEQAEAFEAYCVGKTLAEIAAMPLKDYHGGKAPEGDLAASVTITVDGPLAALAKAK